MNRSFEALSQVQSVRAQLKERAAKAGKGALADAIAALDKKTAELEGAAQSNFYGLPPGAKQPENFSSLNSISAASWLLRTAPMPHPRRKPLPYSRTRRSSRETPRALGENPAAGYPGPQWGIEEGRACDGGSEQSPRSGALHRCGWRRRALNGLSREFRKALE